VPEVENEHERDAGKVDFQNLFLVLQRFLLLLVLNRVATPVGNFVFFLMVIKIQDTKMKKKIVIKKLVSQNMVDLRVLFIIRELLMV
jgi:hypothetical protein